MSKLKKIDKALKKGNWMKAIMLDTKIDVSALKSYSDLAIDIPAHGLDGYTVRIDDILNIPIVITDFKDDLKSKFLDDNNEPMTYCVIQFFVADDEEQNRQLVNTASRVLHEKLILCKDSLPFVTKIIKSNKHYRFV
jgi:hypothetical protein